MKTYNIKKGNTSYYVEDAQDKEYELSFVYFYPDKHGVSLRDIENCLNWLDENGYEYKREHVIIRQFYKACVDHDHKKYTTISVLAHKN